MRRRAKEHVGAVGATAVTLFFVLAYSFWGMSVLHAQHKSGSVAVQGQEQTLAVK